MKWYHWITEYGLGILIGAVLALGVYTLGMFAYFLLGWVYGP